jgi:hypothetical protein
MNSSVANPRSDHGVAEFIHRAGQGDGVLRQLLASCSSDRGNVSMILSSLASEIAAAQKSKSHDLDQSYEQFAMDAFITIFTNFRKEAIEYLRCYTIWRMRVETDPREDLVFVFLNGAEDNLNANQMSSLMNTVCSVVDEMLSIEDTRGRSSELQQRSIIQRIVDRFPAPIAIEIIAKCILKHRRQSVRMSGIDSTEGLVQDMIEADVDDLAPGRSESRSRQGERSLPIQAKKALGLLFDAGKLGSVHIKYTLFVLSI